MGKLRFVSYIKYVFLYIILNSKFMLMFSKGEYRNRWKENR